MKLIAFLALATMTATASAQTATYGHPASDAEKVADALRAGPTSPAIRMTNPDALIGSSWSG